MSPKTRVPKELLWKSWRSRKWSADGNKVQDGRLTSAFFAFSQFGTTNALLKDENVFPSQKHFSFIFSNFSNVQSFLFFFCQINFIMRAEITFLRNITILYAFYCKFATFSDFWKIEDFFRKNHLFFKKKPQILNILRNFTSSVAFYGKFATFSSYWKKTKIFFRRTHPFKKNPTFEHFEKFYYFSHTLRQICNNLMKKKWHSNSRCWLVYASSIGKHRVKKRSYLGGRFCFPDFQYGAK